MARIGGSSSKLVYRRREVYDTITMDIVGNEAGNENEKRKINDRVPSPSIPHLEGLGHSQSDSTSLDLFFEQVQAVQPTLYRVYEDHRGDQHRLED